METVVIQWRAIQPLQRTALSLAGRGQGLDIADRPATIPKINTRGNPFFLDGNRGKIEDRRADERDR